MNEHKVYSIHADERRFIIVYKMTVYADIEQYCIGHTVS